MFVLATFKRTVRVPPLKFHLKHDTAIEEELNGEYADKVVHKVGLGVALWQLKQCGESFILPGDGAYYVKVTFDYVMFRPFVNSILIGRIKSASRESVQITMGFFDDITIPAEYLQTNSIFCDQLQTWMWQVDVDGQQHQLPMEFDQEIRFRVVAEKFTDTSPTGPSDGPSDGPSRSLARPEDEPKVPYLITAAINEDGLGLLSWWTQ